MLLNKDINYHDLGLLIIDEEQRFGVSQKEKIKAIAVVKGGEISGSMIAESKNLIHPLEMFARTEVKAKKKPNKVPHKPTKVAKSKLFQKA